MITTVQCSVCSQLNSKPRVHVITTVQCSVCSQLNSKPRVHVITTVQCSVCSQLNNKPRVHVITTVQCSVCSQLNSTRVHVTHFGKRYIFLPIMNFALCAILGISVDFWAKPFFFCLR